MPFLRPLALAILVISVFGFRHLPVNAAERGPAIFSFNIPAQPLDSALVSFSMQANINIVGLSEALKVHMTTPVQGQKTWQDALDALLLNTGLTYRILSGQSVSIMVAEPATETIQAQQEQPVYLEEIIVSATRRSLNLQNTPIAVSALNQITLDRNKIQDLRDIGGIVPGLEMITSPSQAAVLVQLRGVGTTNITEIADGPVAIHVDGVYAPRSQAVAALLYDVDRIEVLRGPQGTLFGRNATSGSINVYNRQPVFDVSSGDMLITRGNYNTEEIRGAINLPLANKLSLRLAGAQVRHDAYTDLLDNYAGLAPHYPDADTELGDYQQALNLGQDGPETADQRSWRISGLWQPDDRFSAWVSLEDYRDRGTGIAELDPSLVEQGIRGVVIDSPIFVDLSNRSLRSRLEYRPSNKYTISYVFGRSRMAREQIYDVDSGRDGSFEQQHTVSSDFDFDSHEIQILNTDDSRLRWLIGAHASREKNSIVFATDQQNAGGNRSPDGASSWISDLGGAAVFFAVQPDRRVKSLGIYAQATYDLDKTSRLTLGGRYSEDTKSDRDGRTINCRLPSVLGPYTVAGTVGPGAPRPEQIYADPRTREAILAGVAYDDGTSAGIGDEPCWISQVNDFSATWSNTSGLIRYDFDLSNSAMLYASASTGFKSGHIQDAGNNADPETVINYELGVKSRFLNNNLRVNAALYRADYHDLQFSNLDRLDTDGDGIADTSGSTIVRNASEATIKGLELEVEWAITQKDRLQFAGALMDGRFDQFQIPDTLFGNLFNPYGFEHSDSPLDPVDLSGNSPPRTPDWKFTAIYEHDFAAFGGLVTPRILATFSDHYYLDIYNRNELAAGIFPQLPDGGAGLGIQKAYRTVDLSLRFEPASERWLIEAFVKNATDENIKIAAGNFITAEGFTAIYMPPRTFGLTCSYTFGDGKPTPN